ncbi:hypothetical protein AOQ84DRAFT_427313 [Glonium stellatum]|uniref:Nephrocystin 3-like N-terminal domain-containing protein n=1 Tax=Glonium stellatum TaxID=574774 RepID=A0A8E2ENP2_9PEZI|nr:hypothetical protein AOQ84DRAFT_427313 [Glonium stellatum]
MGKPGSGYGHILRSLVSKLLRDNGDLLAYIYDEYFFDRKTASPTNLEQLILTLVLSNSNSVSKFAVRIVLDGIDECEEDQQRRIVGILDRIIRLPTTGTVCKVLISSRDTPKLMRLSLRKSSISLNDETTAVSKAIQCYIQKRLDDMKLELPELQITDSHIDYVRNAIVAESDVLDTLSVEVFCFQDMKAAIDSLPKGLPEFYGRILNRLNTQFGSASLERARRILSWVAFTKRPIKTFELRAVIELQTENTILTTLLLNQVFDWCKPLIEISSEGVLRYLVDPTTCVAYLTSALRVFSLSYSEHDRNCRVGKGFHGFHNYAHEFWIEYLLEFAKIDGDHIIGGLTPLSSSLRNFCSVIHQIGADLSAIMDGDTNSPNVDARLALLAADNQIYAAVANELRSRSRRKDGTQMRNSAVAESTARAQALRVYQGTVQFLLSSDSYPGLSREELEKFKATHIAEAYTCRYPGCPHASTGFESDQLHCRHENMHDQPLKCAVPKCKFGLSFSSTRAPKSHTRKFHSTPITTSSPKSIRRLALPFSFPLYSLSDGFDPDVFRDFDWCERLQQRTTEVEAEAEAEAEVEARADPVWARDGKS